MIKLQARIYSEFFGYFKMVVPEVADRVSVEFIDNKKFDWLPGEKWFKNSGQWLI